MGFRWLRSSKRLVRGTEVPDLSLVDPGGPGLLSPGPEMIRHLIAHGDHLTGAGLMAPPTTSRTSRPPGPPATGRKPSHAHDRVPRVRDLAIRRGVIRRSDEVRDL